ncbi:MAG TPA: hypothetical protein VNY84_01580, partial [Acidimicrobiales bacterium]|nr:hypothetical protein [Acidimicrobiales bacterium]
MTGRHVWGSGARRGQTIRRTLTGIAIATSVAMTGVTGIVLTPGVAHADVAPGVGPGSLDSSFGSSGKATYVLNGATLTADSNPVVVPGGSNAGKIVFVGHVASANPQTVYVVRLNADGSPDTTFGGASTPGAAATDFGLPSSFGAGPPTFMHGAVAVQPDGNIVVTGAKVTDSSGDTAIQVERLLGTTGALDATFGTAGARTVQLNTNSTNDHGDGVALLPSGKILISAWDGAGNTAASHARFAVIQLTSAGALDTASFGAGKGFAETSFSNQADDTSQAVAVQPDGHIVLAGFAKVDVGANTDGIGVVRYNSNGTLDPTFNGTGKVSTNISGGSGATGVVVDVKGEVSVAGFGSGQAMVARYTPGGALDSAFGSDPIVNMPGVQTFNFTGGSAVANGIVQDAQGRLLVTGVDNGSGNNDIGVARFNTNGDPANSNFPFDGLFGSEGGRESFNCPNTSLFQTLWGTGIAVPSDGRVLLLGQCAGPNSYNGNADQGVVVLRLNIDPL